MKQFDEMLDKAFLKARLNEQCWKAKFRDLFEENLLLFRPGIGILKYFVQNLNISKDLPARKMAPYRIPPQIEELAKEEFFKLVANKVLVPFDDPILAIPKKN